MHTAGDALCYSINIRLYYLSRREKNAVHPFGYARYSVIGGLLSGMIIVIGAIMMSAHAAKAIVTGPQATKPVTVMFASGIGLIVNIGAMFLIPHTGSTDFHGHSHAQTHKRNNARNGTADSIGNGNQSKQLPKNKDLNLHGILRNLLADGLSTLLILLTSMATHWIQQDWTRYLDPVCSLVIAAIIIFVIAKPLLQQAILVLVQSTPKHLDPQDICVSIEKECPGITITDLKLWTLVGDQVIGHVHIELSRCDSINASVEHVKKILYEFGVKYSTVEIKLP